MSDEVDEFHGKPGSEVECRNYAAQTLKGHQAEEFLKFAAPQIFDRCQDVIDD